MVVGKKIQIKGIVQGVGFRPFVYNLASTHGITGWVRNSSAGVEIIANGQENDISIFLSNLQDQPPLLSKIDSINIESTPPGNFINFEILHSEPLPDEFLPVSPDVAICDDCLSELFNPDDRRFRYPFINCTNCGPRFTIIQDIPYDRPLTTMADFMMCELCKGEYENPKDRRFHAQPIACKSCGPQVWFEDKKENRVFGEEGLKLARQWIKDGKIVAIKGLGGFHLACNAYDEAALTNIRNRKKRSDKPFALMIFNSKVAETHCEINHSEKFLLESKERPIIILKRKSTSKLPLSIAPGAITIGMMLPYTPLHYLLLEPEDGYPDALVMTSGNMSEEPIAFSNSNAISDLNQIADGYLFHDREIETRVDDSVVTVIENQMYFFRRSRGFAPEPVRVSVQLNNIIAVGAELKNTFCISRDHYAFLSHHIGDLENIETLQAFETGIPHFEKLFRINPTAIACDLHPDYLSSQYAHNRSIHENLPLIQVQHHHAHLASVLADNDWQENEPVIGICFDGTGYGQDGNIWGGEFLYGNYAHCERLFHLEYMPLPGGDNAIHYPAKIAVADLWKNGLDLDDRLPPLNQMSDESKNILLAQLKNDINCPKTSSMGRLFDAVSSLAGLRQQVNYEAQAAIELENIINPDNTFAYNFVVEEGLIKIKALLQAIVADLQASVSASDVAAKFHNAIRKMVLEVCSHISTQTGCKTIALSGGVWQNRYLTTKVINDLQRTGYKTLIHQQVPANDGGLALGQVMVANFQLKNNF